MSKTTELFKAPTDLPEPDRELIVVFVDRTMAPPVRYCANCEAWHTRKGDLKPTSIHQWAYANEFYDSLKVPTPEMVEEKQEGNKEDIAEAFLKLLLLAALADRRKGYRFQFN
ncbi:hypothetical protein [Acinetobacter sp. BWR-L5]|uniref:hypothetical protein n=1 Tax=Acinetobacter sp. BWR-L5 TaxID=2815725 RepID=UPI0031FEE1C7